MIGSSMGAGAAPIFRWLVGSSTGAAPQTISQGMHLAMGSKSRVYSMWFLKSDFAIVPVHVDVSSH